uniref:Uncharacterized protein n=1 Tax=Cucumis sativus TaxID=3659 RepID=A0A0A0LHU9_CUCSA
MGLGQTDLLVFVRKLRRSPHPLGFDLGLVFWAFCPSVGMLGLFSLASRCRHRLSGYGEPT